MKIKNRMKEKAKFYFTFILIFLLLPINLFITKKPVVLAEKENFTDDSLLIRLKSSSKIYEVPAYGEVEEREKLISQMPEVDWVEPNYLFHIESIYTPQDPFYSEQWYLEKIDAATAWEVGGFGLNEIAVAVLDTGVDINHPDLKANIWHNQEEKKDGLDNDGNGYIDDIDGWDFLSESPDPRPKLNEGYNKTAVHHGTLIAGIIAAESNNNEGIIGLSPKIKIMALRALDSQGNGKVGDVIRALYYALEKGAKIINLSFVGPNKSRFLEEALEEAYKQGVIIVAASGNERSDASSYNLNLNPVYPICYDVGKDANFIIGVGATDRWDKRADFSNYGYNGVDISAPGTGFFGTLFYDGGNSEFQSYYGGYWSGTSLATPLVASAAALVLSQNPLLKPEEVINILLESTDNIDILNPNFAGQLGKGRLNAGKAIVYTRTVIKEKESSFYLVTGAGQGGGPHVRVFDLSTKEPISSFFAYDKNFKGGVDVAVGDVNGDGEEEIITAAGKGGGPHIRVFDIYGNAHPHFFVDIKNFWGGLNIASGDVDGDGLDEIIVGLGPNGPPYVFVYDCLGKEKRKFLAYDKNFKGGVNVTVGDVNGDGLDEIITGAGEGGGPHVRVFNGEGNLLFHFFAFNKEFKGGINVSSANVFGDGKDEIIVSISKNASPYVRVFDSEFLTLGLQFLAYLPDFYGGVEIASRDFNSDGQAEIITGPRKGMEPRVRLFNIQGNPISEIVVYDKNFKGGVYTAILKKKTP